MNIIDASMLASSKAIMHTILLSRAQKQYTIP